MRAREIHEAHRGATPLELLFDLTLVVAVAQVARELAHGIAADHVRDVLGVYVLAFFAIWWAWMNFTWFASAYDCDDVGYRLLTLLPRGWHSPASSCSSPRSCRFPGGPSTCQRPSWHPHHIAERYGLFTIIVLGESVLAATTAAESAVSEAGLSVELVLGGSAASGSSSVCGGSTSSRTPAGGWSGGARWASVTAEAVSHEIEASDTLVVLAAAVPVALFLLVVWALHAPLGGAPAHGTARMLPGVVAVLAVVALVEVGLPLGWATLLLCLPPAALVAEHHWPRAEVTAGRARAS